MYFDWNIDWEVIKKTIKNAKFDDETHKISLDGDVLPYYMDDSEYQYFLTNWKG